MSQIMAAVEWVKANWTQIIGIITSIIGVASIIVKLTPTIKDNEILEKIIKFLGKYIALNRSVDDNAIRNGTATK